MVLGPDGRRPPAKVYPSPSAAEGWIGEPPGSIPAADDETTAFTGSRSLTRALEHAYCIYGSASHFSR